MSRYHFPIGLGPDTNFGLIHVLDYSGHSIMCGFAGFLSYGVSTYTREYRTKILGAMDKAIAHRGPDDVRFYDDGFLSLVFRRLSIVDMKSGAQPIYNESGKKFIVANGEIYNHSELRKELEDRHKFSTHSDCEVPLHAFEEWEDESLNRLRGMFAFAIWDKEKKQLFLARDRLGIKPLYVCFLPNGLIFGSELKALLAHPDCPRNMDWTQLDLSALAYSPTNSYIKGVDCLAGGETLRVSFDGKVERRRYWNIEDFFGTGTLLDAGAYKKRYREILEQAVDEHLQGEADACLHLSGGLDSSLLAVLLGRRRKDLACFTVVERTTYADGDVVAARELTNQLGLPWFPVLFDYRTVLEEMRFDLKRFEEFVRMMDSPRFDLEWVFKSEIDRVAKLLFPEMKVRFVGQGADEFAGGYSHRADRLRPNWHSYIRDEVEPGLVMVRSVAQGIQSKIGRMLPPRHSEHLHATSTYHQMMTLFVRQLQHHNLWHEDRSSSWLSLEARVPFLDHRLVELLASIPEALHEKLFWKKQIVRDAMSHFLPSFDTQRAKIAFLETRDTRSVQMITHDMALRIADDFRREYIEAEDFPFDREQMTALLRRVVNRSPGFFEGAEQLLSCFAICVFDRQCRQRDSAVAGMRADHPALKVLGLAELEAIGQSLCKQPLHTNEWQLDEIVRLPESAEIVMPVVKGDSERFMLKAHGAICSEFSLPRGKLWRARFLLDLSDSDSAHFSVKDWIDEFDLQPAEFFEYLDILFQCGFIERAQSQTEMA